ncbi:MAG TPA: hypothetical protein VFO94_04710 [Gammaproteobacteria bacterium]|jgi:hypothetical protein|nr:hypothetical protein [Gammaproteobacteria bacterium]
MPKRAPKPAAPRGDRAAPQALVDDTAARRLTPAERRRLDIDAWEPSLLRALLEAHNKLPADEA